MRFELRAVRYKNAPIDGVEVDVRAGEEVGSMKSVGKLVMTRAEWALFWQSCEMGGNEAGVDIIAYEEEV